MVCVLVLVPVSHCRNQSHIRQTILFKHKELPTWRIRCIGLASDTASLIISSLPSFLLFSYISCSSFRQFIVQNSRHIALTLEYIEKLWPLRTVALHRCLIAARWWVPESSVFVSHKKEKLQIQVDAIITCLLHSAVGPNYPAANLPSEHVCQQDGVNTCAIVHCCAAWLL